MVEEIAPQLTQLKTLAALLEGRVQFPALMPGCLQQPATPAPQNPNAFGSILMYTYPNTDTQKYKWFLKSITWQ